MPTLLNIDKSIMHKDGSLCNILIEIEITPFILFRISECVSVDSRLL